MRELTYAEAIREALREEMLRSSDVFVLGEDVGKYGGAQKVTLGLYEEFGPDRVIDSPISEAAILGAGIGAALMGMRPVVEIMYMDFLPIGSEQILNHAAKIHFMSGGQFNVPLVVRTQYSLGRVHGAQHSQFFPAWFLNIPGLYTVLPSTPYDAKGLLKTAIRGSNPVVFIECCRLYHKLKGPVPEEDYTIPMGKADLKREGSDLTIIAVSGTVPEALAAGTKLQEIGISVEVIDPRTISPLDTETIVNSVKKTNRAIVVSEDCKMGGIAQMLSSVVYESAFDHLDARVELVSAPDMPIPFSRELENKCIPSSERIVETATSILGV